MGRLRSSAETQFIWQANCNRTTVIRSFRWYEMGAPVQVPIGGWAEEPLDPMSASDTLAHEGRLRSEFYGLPGVKEFQKIENSYRRLLSSDSTAAGDMAMIFNFMKMLGKRPLWGPLIFQMLLSRALNSHGKSS